MLPLTSKDVGEMLPEELKKHKAENIFSKSMLLRGHDNGSDIVPVSIYCQKLEKKVCLFSYGNIFKEIIPINITLNWYFCHASFD